MLGEGKTFTSSHCPFLIILHSLLVSSYKLILIINFGSVLKRWLMACSRILPSCIKMGMAFFTWRCFALTEFFHYTPWAFVWNCMLYIAYTRPTIHTWESQVKKNVCIFRILHTLVRLRLQTKCFSYTCSSCTYLYLVFISRLFAAGRKSIRWF